MNGLKEALNKSILDLSEHVNFDFLHGFTGDGMTLGFIRLRENRPTVIKSRPVSTRKKASETV